MTIYKPQADRLAHALAEVRKAGRDGITRNGLARKCEISAFYAASLLRLLRLAGGAVVRGRNVSARWYVPALAPPEGTTPVPPPAELANPIRAPRSKNPRLADLPDDELVTRPVVHRWVDAGSWVSTAPAGPASVWQLGAH